MKADERLGVFVYFGTPIEAHLLGRAREGKPVVVLGRRWTIDRMRKSDGAWIVILIAQPKAGPLICSACGNLTLVEDGDAWLCSPKLRGCGRRGPANGVVLDGSDRGAGG